MRAFSVVTSSPNDREAAVCLRLSRRRLRGPLRRAAGLPRRADDAWPGIPPEKTGNPDPEHGIRHAAFHRHRKGGGTVTPDGRIILDSGVMDPEQLTAIHGQEAGKVWAKSRLKSRL